MNLGHAARGKGCERRKDHDDERRKTRREAQTDAHARFRKQLPVQRVEILVGVVRLGWKAAIRINAEHAKGRRARPARVTKNILAHPATETTPAGGFFNPDQKMSELTGTDIERYKTHRLTQGAKPATVNRELSSIKRAFRLLMKDGVLFAMPSISMLAERNVRSGFCQTVRETRALERVSLELSERPRPRLTRNDEFVRELVPEEGIEPSRGVNPTGF